MPLLHGKQIQNSSIILNKLSGTGSLILQSGATLQVPTSNISTATDVVNKEYVDSVASGLDPKESVYLVAVSNVTTNGTQSIDGVTASLGQRVLLTGQSSAVNNGIYVVGPTAWTRATDSDGNPGNEVSLGNFTFVERGASYSSIGWILYDTDAVGATVSPGVNTQLWTQFSNAGAFTWGDGLANTGNNVYVDIAPNSGLTFSAAQLTINSTIGGNGLAYSSGVLSVNTANGLQIVADNVEVAPTIAGNGLTFSSGVIDVNTSNGITIIGDSVQLNQTVAGDGLTFSGGVINVNANNGLSVSSDTVKLGGTLSQAMTTIAGANNQMEITGLTSGAIQAFRVQTSDSNSALTIGNENNSLNDYSTNGYIQVETNGASLYLYSNRGEFRNLNNYYAIYAANQTIADGSTNNRMIIRDAANSKGLVYHGDYTANFTTYSLVTKQYVDTAIAASGDITGVTAGAGLTGGGASGYVTLDVNTDNGLSITNDYVGLGGSLVRNTTISNTTNIFTMSSTGGDIYFNTIDGGGTAQTRTLVADGIGTTSSLTTAYSSNTVKTIDSVNRVAEINTTVGGTSYLRSVSTAGTSSVIATLTGISLDAVTANILVRNNNTTIGDGSTNNKMIVTDLTNSKGLVYAGDYTANFTTYSLVTKQYVDTAIAASGDITGVTAGDGLSGGGASGYVTLDINTGVGITISSDAVSLTPLGATTSLGSANTVNTFTYNNYGQITTSATLSISIPSGQVNNFTSSVQSLISASAATIVNAGTGITVTQTGFSATVSLANTAVTPGSYGSPTTVSTFTVDQQGRLTAAGGSLIAIPSSQVTDFTSQVSSLIVGSFGMPVYTQRNLTPVATTGNGASSSLTLTSTPKNVVNVSVYVNGQLQFLGNGTTASVDCYFGTQSATAKNISAVTSGDTLFWNGTYVGYDLATSDKIDIIYNA